MKFSGTPNGSFTLSAEPGESFGPHPGKVTLSGRRLTIDTWSHTTITGSMPPEAQPGPIVVTTGDSTPDIHDATELYGGYGILDRTSGRWRLPAEPRSASTSPASASAARVPSASSPTRRLETETTEQRAERHAREDHEASGETPAHHTERMARRREEPPIKPVR